MIEETLQEIGISKRESLCYVALLGLGASKVGEIVQKTQIPSSKIYEVLDRLIKRGLVSYVIKNNIKNYQATDPHVLLKLIEEKKNRVEEIIPQLMIKQRFTTKNSVEIYEGQKALFTLFINLIRDAKPKEPYLIFSINEENKSNSANIFFKNLALRRKRKNLDVRLLKNKKFYLKEKHTKLKMRYTDFNLPQGITIFRDNVIFLTWLDSPIAIRIQSNKFSEPLKEFFYDLWAKSKEYL